MRRFAVVLVIVLPCLALWQFGAQTAGAGLMALGLPTFAARFIADGNWKALALAEGRHWQQAAEIFASDPASAYNRGNALAHAGHYKQAVEAYQAALDIDPDNADAVFNKTLVAALLAGDDEAGGALTNGANSPVIQERHGRAHPASAGQSGGSGNGFAGSQEGISSPGARGSSKVAKVGKGGQLGAEAGGGQATGSAGSGAGAGRAGGMTLETANAISAAPLRVQRMMETRSIAPTREWLMSVPDDPGKYLKSRLLAEQARRRGQPLAAMGEQD